MAERIRGITVEIGGDTTGLDQALRGLNDTSRDLQNELKDVQRLLKFDPNNAELLAQRQRLLNDQIANTSDRLNQLRAVEAQVQAQFEQGDIGAEQYRAFQRELQDAEQSLRHYQGALQDMDAEQQNVQRGTQDLQRIFEITGTTVEDYAEVLGSRLVRAIQNGSATSRQLQQAFGRIGAAATGSSGNLDALRREIGRLESGEASIDEVRRGLEQIGQEANDAEGEVKGLGGELANLAAGAAAGFGVGSIIEKSLDLSALDTKIDISFDVPEESKAVVKDSINTITAYGIEGEAALEGVRRQWALNADLGDATNQRIAQGAATISAAYGDVDFTELIQESSEMASVMNMSQEEALGMTNALLKMGFPPDQLDIMAEYGNQLSMAGYTAQEIQGVFAAGVETDSWNIDVLLDGLKEGRIGLAEFGTGIDESTAKVIEGTGISSEQLKGWGTAVAEGGTAGKEAMMQVALALSSIEDGTKRNAVGTALFGTLWEEQGSKITETLLGATEKTGNLKVNNDALNQSMAALDSSPQVQLNNALTGMQNALIPLFTWVANFITQLATWAQQNPRLAAGIAAVAVAIGIVVGIGAVLLPLLIGISGIVTVVSAAFAFLVSPIGLAIAAFVAIMAIGILVIKNWDKIAASAKKLGATVSKKFGELKDAASKKMQEVLSAVKRIWKNVENFFNNINLRQMGKDAIQGFINGIGSMASAVARKAREVANGVGNAVKKILKLGSPSKVTEEMGEFAGEGLAIGLENTISRVRDMSNRLAANAIPKMEAPTPAAAVETGGSVNRAVTVNIHSPKALDVREASKQFSRTLNKMSLMW
jgi:phage-related minor tail protein